MAFIIFGQESLKSSPELEIKTSVSPAIREVKEVETTRLEKTNAAENKPIEDKSKSDKGETKDASSQQEQPAPAGNDKTELAKTEKGGDRPPSKKLKDGSSKRSYPRRKEEHHDLERNRTGQGSREFVRGGRGKAFGYGGRGRSGGGGGGREHGGVYGQGYDGPYDIEAERLEMGGNDNELKTLDYDEPLGGGKQFPSDGRWRNTQNKPSGTGKESSGSRSKDKPRGQRSGRFADDKSAQEPALQGHEKPVDVRPKPARPSDDKEAAGAPSVDLEKDLAKLELNAKSSLVKDSDFSSRKEPTRQGEGTCGLDSFSALVFICSFIA